MKNQMLKKIYTEPFLCAFLGLLFFIMHERQNDLDPENEASVPSWFVSSHLSRTYRNWTRLRLSCSTVNESHINSKSHKSHNLICGVWQGCCLPLLALWIQGGFLPKLTSLPSNAGKHSVFTTFLLDPWCKMWFYCCPWQAAVAHAIWVVQERLIEVNKSHKNTYYHRSIIWLFFSIVWFLKNNFPKTNLMSWYFVLSVLSNSLKSKHISVSLLW